MHSACEILGSSHLLKTFLLYVYQTHYYNNIKVILHMAKIKTMKWHFTKLFESERRKLK